MPVFEYEVVDQRGTLGRGSAEAEDQGDLIQQLRGQGQLVLSVRRAAGSARPAGGGRFGLAALGDAWVQAIRSVSSGVPLTTLVLINTVVSLFAGLLPIPGGMGVTEAGLTIGLTNAGLSSEIAFAAAIAYRFCSFYLPPVWGFFCYRWLVKRRFL